LERILNGTSSRALFASAAQQFAIMGSPRRRGGSAAPPPLLAPRRPLLRRGLGAREDEEDAGGAGPRIVIWSGANSVAWGARFLGPDGGGNATASSLTNSSSQSSGQQQPQEQGQGGGAARASGGGESSSLFIGVIVALILCFYLLCTYQCLRMWLCSKLLGREDEGGVAGGGPGGGADGGSANTVLVHEGRVFNLSGDQRRQVLEVIFSESSKVRAAATVPFDCPVTLLHGIRICFFFFRIALPLTR
jgi:hypothetical protein